MKYLVVLLVLFSTPSYAKVLPAVWDGVCTPIHASPYMVVNPDSVNPYQKGYIPPKMTISWADIPEVCFPPVTAGGPK